MPNNAAQWGRAERIQYGTETQSRRPLHLRGWNVHWDKNVRST